MQNSFRSHSGVIQKSFRLLSELIQNASEVVQESFRCHSEPIQNSFRNRSELGLNSLRTHMNSCFTPAELIQKAFRSHSKLIQTFPHMFVFAFLEAPGTAFSCFLAVFSSIWDRFGCPFRVILGFLGALFLFSILGGCPVIAFSSLRAKPASKRAVWGAFRKTSWCPGGQVKIAFSCCF